MKILFYGRLADSIAPEVEMQAAPDCSVAELRQRLASEYPGAGETLASRRSRACVGDCIVGEDYRLGDANEIEFLPPVSGG